MLRQKTWTAACPSEASESYPPRRKDRFVPAIKALPPQGHRHRLGWREYLSAYHIRVCVLYLHPHALINASILRPLIRLQLIWEPESLPYNSGAQNGRAEGPPV